MLLHGSVAQRIYATQAYTPDAVTFDGTNDYLTRGALVGATDGNSLTISSWFRLPANETGYPQIFRIATSGGAWRVLVYFYPDRSIGVALKDAAGTSLFDYNMGVPGTTFSTNAWHHFIMSINVSTGSWHSYIDNISIVGNNPTPINGNINFSGTIVDVGGPTLIDSDLAEIYFTNEYIDLSVQSNREKFILNNAPVNLGSDGSSPTGTSPLVYLKGDAASWNAGTNYGTGGNFTMTGAVTDSTNEPVQTV